MTKADSNGTSAEGVSVFEMFGTDINSAEDGKWFDFGPKMRVKIRRFNSKKSQKVRERLEAPYKNAMRSGGLPPAVAEQITEQQIAEGIVVDWDGVLAADLTPIPFSVAAAQALFDKLPDFRDAIIGISLDVNKWREQKDEEVAKN